METTRVLIKNGIESILYENDENFKQNIVSSLSMKLNYFIEDARSIVKKDLLKSMKITESTNEIKYFISFYEQFKPGKFSFQDGSVINITEENMQSIRNLFESLNPDSRQQMASEIFENAQSFEKHISFANQIKELL
jgi:hypothetical protein